VIILLKDKIDIKHCTWLASYGLDDWGLMIGKDRWFFCSPVCLYRFWAQSNSYSMGTGSSFRWLSGGNVKLTTQINLVSSFKMCGALPLLLHTSSKRGAYGKGTLLCYALSVHILYSIEW